MLFQAESTHQYAVEPCRGHSRGVLLILFFAMLLAKSSPFIRGAEALREHAIFKSTDHGRTWSRSDQGITGNPRVNAFASVGDVIVAGTDSGIFVSHDEARTWRAAGSVPKNSGRILALASLGNMVIAGTDRNGLLVSSDAGDTWIVNSSFPSKYVRTLLAYGNYIYAGTESDGVFVSKNSGQSWNALREGLPANAQVFALAKLDGRLFAGLYSKGLYTLNLSASGQRWTKIGNVSPLALATFGSTLLAGHNPGGVHWSDDGGLNWSRGTLSLLPGLAGEIIGIHEEAFGQIPVWDLISNTNLSLLGAGSGIYFSEDRGHTWTRARSGLPEESPGISFLLKPKFALAGTLIKKE